PTAGTFSSLVGYTIPFLFGRCVSDPAATKPARPRLLASVSGLQPKRERILLRLVESGPSSVVRRSGSGARATRSCRGVIRATRPTLPGTGSVADSQPLRPLQRCALLVDTTRRQRRYCPPRAVPRSPRTRIRPPQQ